MAKLLFDLDECLYVGDLIIVAQNELENEGRRFDQKYSGRVAKDFQFSNLPEILRERLFKIFSDSMKACVNKTPLPGAYATLWYLHSHLHEIGFVTSRPASLKEATEFVIQRDFPFINWHFKGFANKDRVHTKSISKIQLIKEFKPDYYFDDHVGYCNDALQAGVKAKNIHLISNCHTGWNHSAANNPMTPFTVVKSILDFDLRRL